MTNDIVIFKALRLPAPDIEALLQGRSILAISNQFINRDKFALYSTDILMNPLPVEQYYHPNFVHIAQRSLRESVTHSLTIKTWAKCEWCHDINPETIATLSKLTIWTKSALEETLALRKNIFFLYLRVYHLSKPIQIIVKENNQFIPLPKRVTVDDTNPVLTDNIFKIRKRQLEKLEPPQHPELERLLDVVSPQTINNPRAKQLEQDIHKFLGWSNSKTIKCLDSDLAWTKEIAALGNRSKQEDSGKSNYQAGTDFENIIRQSLEFLGFTVDYFHKGGAGGVDVFCSHPYPLVGECKAGKKIPNNTAVQLLNLGTLRLQSQELFKQATKLIIGPGEPTIQLKEAAKVHGMAIINPETLEKLVELQNKYRNSIDLFKLKDFLKAGQSDIEIEKYIVQVEEEIKLRSHLVGLVKNYLESSGLKNIGVDALHGAYFGSNPPQPLKIKEMQEILIELSSPLTGYLGRIKSTDGKSDKFYFLRDLTTDTNSV
ncbi:MAG: DUF1802 family protein [Cyanobacteria bacterium P01_D01_bin.50]